MSASEDHSHPQADGQILVESVDLSLGVSPYLGGWQTALKRPPAVALQPLVWQLSQPGVVSLKVSGERLKVHSFVFSSSDLPLAISPPAADDPDRRKVRREVPATRTRIAPPENVVKLGDRLYYLLQPSLESIFAGGSLSLPFHPFPYQFEGIAFLYPRHSAVLADEMGLGKTMQAITTLRLLLHAGQIRRALLVCPKPLVTNWQREFEAWAPEIPLNVISGNGQQRQWKWQLPDAVITIANYELVHRDRELIAGDGIEYDIVVLDESQRIKNRSGATSQAVRSIPRLRSWALTGTPIENCADDLVGIFDFVAPGHLSPGMRPRRMARAVRDYVLRRTKDQVLDDLPPKLIRDAELDLTDAQRETYRQAEDEGVIRLTKMGASATVTHVFELILRLKQICNFDPATGESSKIDRLIADMEEIAASGKKAIVFSQWVATLEELAQRLQNFGPLQYHGKVPSRRRDNVIQQFREDPSKHVILMSYGAGSVGLNLQFAGYVFLFDRWWNPAVEDQAINRAHRIGAAGPVTVSRFLSIGTIEERINQILEEKREIFDTIFSSNEPMAKKSNISQQEIFGLFNLHTPQGPISEAA